VFGRPEPAKPVEDEKARDLPEQEIALECEQLLREDGWRTIKCEPMSNRGRGKGFGEIGMPDLLALRYSRKTPGSCECLWVEFKSRNGRVKKHQILWHQMERARGALTLIAGIEFPASVEGFRDWYSRSGLMRRSKWW
jgi:hypothetical protein